MNSQVCSKRLRREKWDYMACLQPVDRSLVFWSFSTTNYWMINFKIHEETPRFKPKTPISLFPFKQGWIFSCKIIPPFFKVKYVYADIFLVLFSELGKINVYLVKSLKERMTKTCLLMSNRIFFLAIIHPYSVPLL